MRGASKPGTLTSGPLSNGLALGNVVFQESKVLKEFNESTVSKDLFLEFRILHQVRIAPWVGTDNLESGHANGVLLNIQK